MTEIQTVVLDSGERVVLEKTELQILLAGGGGAGNVDLTTQVIGVLPIANGGTGAASFAAAGLLVSGGALGTPSSGTLTNATGLPVAGVAATGTPDGTTFLRGDGTWSVPIAASTAFSSLTGGTNASAAMVVGTGASLAASGSGTITATAVPASGVTGLGTGVATALAANINAAGGLARLAAGLTANALLLSDGTDLTQSANLTFNGTKLTIANGTATGLDLGLGAATTPALSFGATNTGFYAPSTSFVECVIGGTRVFQVTSSRVSCIVDAGGFTLNSSANSAISGSAGWPNALMFSQAAGGFGAVTSRTEINKAVTAFTDAVAKTVFTLTIPNAAHSASYLVRLTGSIGAGGAIGANEASATNCYVVTICRTAGVNAVATISAAFGAAASNVAGATTVTCTGALAAVSGAVGATNTIDIQATITKAGGASDNHTCVATASLLNANVNGITIA